MPEADKARARGEELYSRAKQLSNRELLALDPKHLRAHNNLGVLYDRLGDYEGALAEYSAAEELDPDDVRLQCNIAAVLASLGRYGEAEAKLDRALHSDPQNADARENLGSSIPTAPARTSIWGRH
jgi:Flp pilus assembly protein TadD